MGAGFSPSDIERMDGVDRHVLYACVEALEAERRLNFMLDVGSIFSGDKEAQQGRLAALVQQAFPDDPERQVFLLEAVTRKG